MNRTDEGALAWALADSAKVFLKPADRARMCAKIGAGEQGSAIKHLLVFYSNTDRATVRAGSAGTGLDSRLCRK